MVMSSPGTGIPDRAPQRPRLKPWPWRRFRTPASWLPSARRLSPRPAGRMCVALSSARSVISLQPPPPGKRPTPTSTSPIYSSACGWRAAACSVISAAAAERHAEGRDHHRLRRKLDRLRHVLELADGQIDFVPLFFLHRHQQHHDVGADGEVGGVVGDDEGVEVVARRRRASATG